MDVRRNMGPCEHEAVQGIVGGPARTGAAGGQNAADIPFRSHTR
jgi:hypothetical protein